MTLYHLEFHIEGMSLYILMTPKNCKSYLQSYFTLFLHNSFKHSILIYLQRQQHNQTTK